MADAACHPQLTVVCRQCRVPSCGVAVAERTPHRSWLMRQAGWGPDSNGLHSSPVLMGPLREPTGISTRTLVIAHVEHALCSSQLYFIISIPAPPSRTLHATKYGRARMALYMMHNS
ncbi:hypothetical protein NDU88_004802 [Pleurodeles waltl]|uniref:Uncharacterized protein n=1 Tax=Pleurodeles waltl TaxID=8319 RepID=A0AAV7LVR4_PLEWA|nr:hypothetical protein NDU88_004802 [Pleurodeles waltl]